MIYLTPHFTLEELIASDTARDLGIDNSPTPEVRDRLAQLAGKLEDVRCLLGAKPVIISSGYRCPQLNKAIGGAETSAHLYGCAADFNIEGMSAYDVCTRLTELDGFLYDQLINEEGSGARWVHIGLAVSGEPRCSDLTIASGVTKTGFYPV